MRFLRASGHLISDSSARTPRVLLAGFVLVFANLSFAGANPEATSNEQIDLQWAICEDDPADVADRLGFKNDSPKLVDVTYYDTNPPRYFEEGATFRTKFKKSKGQLVSMVKLRYANRETHPEAQCEWDRYGNKDRYTCEVEAEDVSETSIWNDKQREFAATKIQVQWPDLEAYGPYSSQAWKTTFKSYTLKLDSVNLPVPLDPLIELSVKIDYVNRNEADAAIEQLLADRGVHLCANQEPKTRRLFRALGFVK